MLFMKQSSHRGLKALPTSTSTSPAISTTRKKTLIGKLALALASLFTGSATLLAAVTAEPSKEFAVGYTTVGNTVTVTLKNLGREAKAFHFVAEEMTNLQLIGTETKITKVCNPNTLTPILQFTKTAPDQVIQLTYKCTAESFQTGPTSARYIGRQAFGANISNTLMASAVIQPSPLLGPTPVPKQIRTPRAVAPLVTPDAKFVYRLPFAAGQSHPIIQGYHGRLTHQAHYALDFAMPIGSPIHASRDGEVVVVSDKAPDQEGGESSLDTADSANQIEIDHVDGTSALYLHLRQSGSAVKLGQKVKAGDLIGYSGNSGSSTRPHLHLEIVETHSRTSRPTLFTTAATPEGVMLQEDSSPTAL